jgi:hypothetical protein
MQCSLINAAGKLCTLLRLLCSSSQLLVLNRVFMRSPMQFTSAILFLFVSPAKYHPKRGN